LCIDLQSQQSRNPVDTWAGEDERFFNTGASMPSFKNSQFQNFQVLSRVARPRLLRAIPSLVALTAAMAWAASSHAGGLGLDGALRGSTGVTVAAGPALGGGMGAGVGVGLGANTAVQPGGGVANAGVGLDAGVRAGANGNVTAEERMAATGSTGAGMQADGGMNASGAVNSATNGVGRVLGGARDTGQTAGSAAARTGKRLTHGVKSGPGSVNHTVNSGVQGAAQLDTGIQGGTTAR
jgi:hypothetical protein